MLKKVIPTIMNQSNNMMFMFSKKACNLKWAKVEGMVNGVDTTDAGAMKAALKGMGVKVKAFHLGDNPNIMRGTKLSMKCGKKKKSGVGYGGIFLRND